MKETLDKNQDMDIAIGGDNVFANLGLPDAEQRLAKAHIALFIEDLIEEKGLTQAMAAQRMGLTQPDVSLIVRGRLRGFTLDRLLSAVMALDEDVTITLRPKKAAASHMTVSLGRTRRRKARAAVATTGAFTTI